MDSIHVACLIFRYFSLVFIKLKLISCLLHVFYFIWHFLILLLCHSEKFSLLITTCVPKKNRSSIRPYNTFLNLTNTLRNKVSVKVVKRALGQDLIFDHQFICLISFNIWNFCLNPIWVFYFRLFGFFIGKHRLMTWFNSCKFGMPVYEVFIKNFLGTLGIVLRSLRCDLWQKRHLHVI